MGLDGDGRFLAVGRFRSAVVAKLSTACGLKEILVKNQVDRQERGLKQFIVYGSHLEDPVCQIGNFLSLGYFDDLHSSLR